jgi:hypothetical protein
MAHYTQDCQREQATLIHLYDAQHSSLQLVGYSPQAAPIPKIIPPLFCIMNTNP